jgi:hypothetical protein
LTPAERRRNGVGVFDPCHPTTISGILNFADGETSKTFSVPILANLLLGGDKTTNLALTDPTPGATLGSQSQAVLTIANSNCSSPTPTTAGRARSARRP